MNEKFYILKTIVGSTAHGLASPDSDVDYRGIYIIPTKEILSLGFKYKGSNWIEGAEDNTSYELGHFLSLAMNCNPSILEVFKAPVAKQDINEDTFDLSMYGKELRELFPYVWNPKGVYDAFVGYGLSQQKKMLDNHLDRWKKYAVAYLRTLKNLIDLLKTKDFSLYVEEGEFRNKLIYIKDGQYSVGDIINMANEMTAEAKEALPTCQNEPDYSKVNDFLLSMRREFF
jgi:hypothetical protein